VNTATEALTSRAMFAWLSEAGGTHRAERLQENGSIRQHHSSTGGLSQLNKDQTLKTSLVKQVDSNLLVKIVKSSLA